MLRSIPQGLVLFSKSLSITTQPEGGRAGHDGDEGNCERDVLSARNLEGLQGLDRAEQTRWNGRTGTMSTNLEQFLLQRL